MGFDIFNINSDKNTTMKKCAGEASTSGGTKTTDDVIGGLVLIEVAGGGVPGPDPVALL